MSELVFWWHRTEELSLEDILLGEELAFGGFCYLIDPSRRVLYVFSGVFYDDWVVSVFPFTDEE